MFIILRRDLRGLEGWGPGPIITQACHATAKALAVYAAHPDTRAYLAPGALDRMHKVTLEVSRGRGDEQRLREAAAVLEAAGLDLVQWREQPEDTLTCLATRPYRRSEVAAALKAAKTSLYRG